MCISVKSTYPCMYVAKIKVHTWLLTHRAACLHPQLQQRWGMCWPTLSVLSGRVAGIMPLRFLAEKSRTFSLVRHF